MKRKLIISYEWHMQTATGNEIVPSRYMEFLEETAEERIKEQMAKGFTSGELSDDIHAFSDDPDDGVSFVGSWECTKVHGEPLTDLEIGQRIFWNDPDDGLCSMWDVVAGVNGEEVTLSTGTEATRYEILTEKQKAGVISYTTKYYDTHGVLPDEVKIPGSNPLHHNSLLVYLTVEELGLK